MGLKTLRGKVDNSETELIFSYSSANLTRAWVVQDILLGDTQTPSSARCEGLILHTDATAKTTFDLGDNQTIGIAWKASADSRIQRVLDPLHVVVGNLYLTSLEATNGPTNYLVILEEIKVANAANILYRLKERAQGGLE